MTTVPIRKDARRRNSRVGGIWATGGCTRRKIWADLSGNKFPAKLLTLQSPGGLLRAMNTDSKVLFHENTEFITYHSNSRKML